MASRPEYTPRFVASLLVSLIATTPTYAQHVSAQTSLTITVTVAPSIAIRSVAPGAPRHDAGGLTTPAMVQVESNLPYRLAVRLAPEQGARGAGNATRILVRNAAGRFEPLVAGSSVTTVVSRGAGRRSHEVLCRVEAPASEPLDAGRCALVYELAAEHNDALLRTSATDYGLRTADAILREAPAPAEASRDF